MKFNIFFVRFNRIINATKLRLLSRYSLNQCTLLWTERAESTYFVLCSVINGDDSYTHTQFALQAILYMRPNKRMRSKCIAIQRKLRLLYLVLIFISILCTIFSEWLVIYGKKLSHIAFWVKKVFVEENWTICCNCVVVHLIFSLDLFEFKNFKTYFF